MAIRPIPIRVLIDSVSIRPFTAEGRHGTTYGSTTTIARVRVEEGRGSRRDSDGTFYEAKAMLFVDAVNSLPAGQVVKVQDEIIFNGTVYHVKEVQYERADGETVHHTEAVLI